MTELNLEQLLNKIIERRYTVTDLEIIERLTRKPKYERMIKKRMSIQLHLEFQMVTSILK